MRQLLLLIAVVSGCTKPNPNRCCVDEADCAAAGLPNGMTCAEGKVCRANVCLEETCGASSDCDIEAPYCVGAPDGACATQCMEDVECPGSSDTAEQKFCANGGCVECRSNADCGGATAICGTTGACRGCATNSDCASGVCEDAGTCAAETQIAYVDLIGSPTSDCTKSAPCSAIEHALGIVPPRPYIVINTGTYTRTGALTIRDTRRVIGAGNPRPIVDRVDDGAIIIAQAGVNLRLEDLELSGATGSVTMGQPAEGDALLCVPGNGAPSVDLRRVVVRNNAGRGVYGIRCTVSIRESTFSQDETGIYLSDANGTVDRSTTAENQVGMQLDGGVFKITNNVVARNVYNGISLYSESTGNAVEFNTIVDNGKGATPLGYGFDCSVTTPAAMPNNIIARNANQANGSMCTFPSSIVLGDDISSLKLVHPDAAPYDYHLLPGSNAIDAAIASTLDHDMDGDMRPKGAGRDVGADEAQ